MSDTPKTDAFNIVYTPIMEDFRRNEEAHAEYEREYQRATTQDKQTVQRLTQLRDTALQQARRERQTALDQANAQGKNAYANAEREKNARRIEADRQSSALSGNAKSASVSVNGVKLFGEQLLEGVTIALIELSTYEHLAKLRNDADKHMQELHFLVSEYRVAEDARQRQIQYIGFAIAILIILAAIVFAMISQNGI